MNGQEHAELWIPARNNLPEFKRKSPQFAEAIGYYDEYLEFMVAPTSLETPMSDELRNLLLALAGPHGATILKVHRIRKGLNVTEKDSDQIQDRDHQETG